MGYFYRVPAGQRGLNYDKYFKDGDEIELLLLNSHSKNTVALIWRNEKQQ
jgi:UDP-glucose 4-epimerase